MIVPRPAISGVIFDKDGTLFDFSQSWSSWAEQVLAELSRDYSVPSERIAAALGYDITARRFAPDSPVIAGTVAEVATAMRPALPAVDPGKLIRRLNASAEGAPMVPVLPLAPFLGRLKARGLRLGLATNDAEGAARAHLEQQDCLPLFDFIAGYDSGFGGKPAPGQLLAFAERFDLAPETIAMVGDSRHDLAAARAGGMRPVAVLTGVAGRAELAPLAEVVLASIRDLERWLDETSADAAP